VHEYQYCSKKDARLSVCKNLESDAKSYFIFSLFWRGTGKAKKNYYFYGKLNFEKKMMLVTAVEGLVSVFFL
jgi:hypothetical protein